MQERNPHSYTIFRSEFIFKWSKNGQGGNKMYIYKRKDNRYEGRYDDPSSNAKSGKRSVYGRTYQETMAKLIQAEANINDLHNKNNAAQSKKITVKDYFRLRLDNDLIIGIKASSYDTYEYYLERHIKPYFKDKKLNEQTRESIQRFINYLYLEGRLDGEGGLDANTVKDIYGFINRGFIQAVEDEILTKNPCKNIRLPSKYSMIEILSDTEQRQLVEYLNACPHPYNTGVLIGLYAGLRIGEICGLQWGDIDMESGLITVKRSLRRTKNRNKNAQAKTTVIVQEPKTENSLRSFYIPKDLLNYLRHFKKTLSESETHNHRYILQGRNGKYLDTKTLQNYFKRILYKAGLPRYKFHALRHTFATRAQENGMDISTLSDILGHHDPAFTVRQYGHSTIENKKIQINKLNDGCIKIPVKKIA